MDNVIKILHLEDNMSDAYLVQSILKAECFDYEYYLADNESDFTSLLKEKKIDIILSDYHLPDYSGAEAMMFVKNKYPQIPFVFVSGTLGETAAIESLLNGAIDYVLKDKLERLIPAIKRALREAKLNAEYNSAIEILRQKEEQYRVLVEGMNEGLIMVDTSDVILFVNQQFCLMTGYSSDELLGKNRISLLYTEKNQAVMRDKMKERYNNIKEIYEIDLLRKDGSSYFVRVSGSPVCNTEGTVIGAIGVVQDINENKLAQQTILLQGAALNAAANAIMICAVDSTIEWVNSAFSSLTGYSMDEVIGKKPNQILNSGNQSHEFYVNLWSTILTGNTWKGEIVNRTKNKSLYFEEQIITPIRNNEGEITHFVAIKTDISERKQVEKRLISAKEKAEESDRLKTSFLQNISHEIRTPMNAIIGFSQLLTKTDLDDIKRKEFVSIICNSSTQLLSIITDIVSIATIETGQETNNANPFDLNAMLLKLFKQFENKFKNESVKFRYDLLPDNKPYIIDTDETKLIQILSNLINNAFKFTKEGFVQVGINEKENELEFYVEDTGIGISEEIHDKIFDRFKQADGSTSRNYGGMGLGLSISKAYTELLGGKMGLASILGKGSRFYFTIPINPNQKLIESVTEEFPENEVKIDAIKTILIAEDEDFNFMLIQEILSPFNFTIIRAVNGVEAVEKCKSNKDIELIIMDIKMPHMDGYEATKIIKSFRPELPIIAQTAYAYESDKQKAIDVGCSDYVSKPINRDLFLSIINRIFNEKFD